MRRKRFYVVSLGCPKNRVDSEVTAAAFLAAGYAAAGEPEAADVLVVNTCSFIEEARRESVECALELAEVKRRRRGARLVLMGCLGRQSAEELAESLPEVDLVAGTAEADRIPELLASRVRRCVEGEVFLPERATPRVLSQSRAFAYLKVGDGCSRRCSFCTIPHFKGPFASRSVAVLAEEAKGLAGMGVKELVLVAQDVTQYGRPGERRLMELLDALERVDGVEWIRLMYLYPEGLTKGLLRRVGCGGKVVPYLDVPLQHVDDRVLRRMGRGTSEARVRRVVEEVRGAAAGVALRTTLIAGFPGEDEAAFEKLVRFVEEVRFERLGAFAFSPEPGTAAAGLDGQVSRRERVRRRDRLLAVQKRISLAQNRALVGERVRVLVEGPSGEHPWVMQARTARQAPEVDGVVLLDGVEAVAGEFAEVRVTRGLAYDLVGAGL